MPNSRANHFLKRAPVNLRLRSAKLPKCPWSENKPRLTAAETFPLYVRSPSSPKIASVPWLPSSKPSSTLRKSAFFALAVIHGFDCAIVRFVFNDTDAAARELAESNYRFTICDLVAVEMPGTNDGLQRITKALLGAEIDIHYCYALITSEKIHGSIAVHVDNPSLAATVLGEEGFRIFR